MQNFQLMARKDGFFKHSKTKTTIKHIYHAVEQSVASI